MGGVEVALGVSHDAKVRLTLKLQDGGRETLFAASIGVSIYSTIFFLTALVSIFFVKLQALIELNWVELVDEERCRIADEPV